MRTLRLVTFGAIVLLYNLAASVAAWAAGWPPQFGGDPNPDQPYGSYLVGGSAIHAPLPPLVALAVGLLLSRRADRWRYLGLVMVAIVGVLFVIGVSGELVAEHPHVPTYVVWGFGTINLIIGGTLLYLVTRERSRAL